MTPQQINRLTQLLLHADATNAELAKTLLLPCYPTVLPQMREASLVYLCFEHTDEGFIQWANEVEILPSEDWEPLSILAQADRVLSPGRHAVALEALPVWQRYSSYLERNRTWAKQYKVAYQQLSRYSGHSTWINYAPLYIFLLRKIVRFRLAATPEQLHDAQRKLAGLLHQHTTPSEATPALIREVRALYQAVHRYRPEDHTVLRDCGDFCETVGGQLAEAQRYYTRYVQAQPKDPTGYSSLARVARQQQQPTLAQEWLLKGIQQADPVYKQAYGTMLCHLAAVQWEDLGDLAAAKQHYRAALSLGSVVVLKALDGFATLLWHTEGKDSAHALFEEVYQQYAPHSPSARIHLEWGNFWIKQDLPEEALPVYERALLEHSKWSKLFPVYAQTLLSLLLKAQEEGDRATVQQWVSHGLAYTADKPMARIEWLSALAAPSLLTIQTLPEVEKAYHELLTQDEVLYRWVNSCIFVDKRWPPAHHLFDHLVARSPEQPAPYRICGFVCEKHLQWEKAQQLYQRALEQVETGQEWFQQQLTTVESHL